MNYSIHKVPALRYNTFNTVTWSIYSAWLTDKNKIPWSLVAKPAPSVALARSTAQGCHGNNYMP